MSVQEYSRSRNTAEFLQVKGYAYVLTWAERIAQRPAAHRGRMVNRRWGEPDTQLRERHDASDFAYKTQGELAS